MIGLIKFQTLGVNLESQKRKSRIFYLQDLVHLAVFHVLGHEVEDEVVCRPEMDPAELLPVHLAHQHCPGELRDGNPGEPVDEHEDGEGEQERPPAPQDQEVLLVEQVVAQDTEEVAAVQGPGGGAVPQGARDLRVNATFSVWFKIGG